MSSSAAIIVGDTARAVDQELFEIEIEIDWLARLSPIDNTMRWDRFRASGYQTSPPLTYAAFDLDVGRLRDRLHELPVDDVEHPSIRVLLWEKRDELSQFLSLVDVRETPAFTTASVALFGGTDAGLLEDAEKILANVPEQAPPGPLADAEELAAEADRVRTLYRQIDPDLDFRIQIVPDTDADLVVHHGDLHVSAELAIPRSRVRPLVAHEVGVHVVTRHNGARQPLRLFESGFAHYDELQEGLATFCEYLSGCLPPTRLRVLAARVVAADLAVRHETLESIFGALHEEYRMQPKVAFDVAVRAKRGGGLTKDAVYLAGLRDVLAYVHDGGDLSQLFIGKYALGQRHLIAELLDEGALRPPALLPECVTGVEGRAHLESTFDLTIHNLCHQEHTP